MKRAIRLVVLAMVLGGLVWGGVWTVQSRAASTAASAEGSYSQVVRVETGSLTSGLSVVGQLEAVQSADLTFEEMSGTAQVLTVATVSGQRVAAGEVLATIDAAPYEQALEQAQNDVAAAEEALAELETPPTELEMAQADVTVAQAQQALAQAEADLADLGAPDLTELEQAVQEAQDNLDLLELQASVAERDALAQSERDLRYSVAWYQLHISQLQELVAEHQANKEQTEQITSDQEALAEAEAELAQVQAERELARLALAAQQDAAEAALATAQEALAEAKTGGDGVTLAQAELAVSQAQVSLQAAQEARAELEEGADATAVALAQADVEDKQQAVREAEAALEGCELTAPFDGTVLETYVSAGEAVAANTAIATVADLETMRVVASVDETTIRQVSVGQSAAISFDAYPNQSFTGEVLSIPMQGTLQGDVTVYEVVLSLSGAEELNLLVGMTANVEIEVGQADDAVLVPTLALSEVNGQYQVLVPSSDASGDPERVAVEVGLSDGTYTQILSGLEAGNQVVVQLEATDSGSSSQSSSSGIFSSLFRMMGRR